MTYMCITHATWLSLIIFDAGGRSPTIQDAVAHADAALHLLQKTVGQESWLTATIAANVQKKSAGFQVRHHQKLKLLCWV